MNQTLITAGQLKVDDWFLLGGMLYRISALAYPYVSKARVDVEIQFYNPVTEEAGTHERYTLTVNSAVSFQILNQ